jgi:hypothetical protein
VVLELGQLPHLVSAIRQSLEEVVVLVFIEEPVGLDGIVKLGGAFQSHLETRFGQVPFFCDGVHDVPLI